MSTSYQFRCLKCKLDGGSFTRQAGGWGHFDIIDSFKFLAYHVENCGPENIRIVSEHNRMEFTDCNLPDEYGETHRQKFLEAARGYFPSSDDWLFMLHHGDDLSRTDADEAWTESELRER